MLLHMCHFHFAFVFLLCKCAQYDPELWTGLKTPLIHSLSSVNSVVDLRTGGRWFDLRLGQYSLRQGVAGSIFGSVNILSED